jgi:hypothetical protein
MPHRGGDKETEKEDDEISRDQQYYTDLLKSLRDDNVRASSPLAYEIGRKDRQVKIKQPYEDDPNSPYRFMQGVKFMIWDSAGLTTRMNTTNKNPDQEREKLLMKTMREETRLNFLCEREAKSSNRFVDTKKEMRVLLEQLKPASTKLDR